MALVRFFFVAQLANSLDSFSFAFSFPLEHHERVMINIVYTWNEGRIGLDRRCCLHGGLPGPCRASHSQ